MTIYKRVPVRAGMAGGSADAAGVLVGLSELYDAHLSMSELCAIGAGIGADVPFALLGGTCRVRGVGDLMKALPPCPDCWFVVAMPSVGVSTPEAFARYDTMGSPVHPDCEAQEQAIRAEDLRAVCAAAGNALEHCSGAVETPSICATLREHGAPDRPDDRQRCGCIWRVRRRDRRPQCPGRPASQLQAVLPLPPHPRWAACHGAPPDV